MRNGRKFFPPSATPLLAQTYLFHPSHSPHTPLTYPRHPFPLSQPLPLPQAKPRTGLISRGEVGLLRWTREAASEGVGSRLKTPHLPVWVTWANQAFGVLFNPNKDLLRDYHAENR